MSRAQDPTESVNLADQHPELVKELLAEAEVILKDAPLQVWILEESQGDFFYSCPRFVATWWTLRVPWALTNTHGEAGGLYFLRWDLVIRGYEALKGFVQGVTSLFIE